MTDPTTPEGRAELRMLYETADLGTLEADCCSVAAIVYDEHGNSIFSDCFNDNVAELAAATVNALPALLDALDKRERLAEVSRIRELNADARAEKAEAALDAIREYTESLRDLATVTRDAGGTYLAHTYDEIATTLERKIGDQS